MRSIALLQLAVFALLTLYANAQKSSFFGSVAGNKTKLPVNIGLVYQSLTKSTAYGKAFKEAVGNVNAGQTWAYIRRVSMVYKLVPHEYYLPRGKFYPSHVLDCLCNKMIAEQVAVIIFVTASEIYDETTAAAQYFMDMASHTGIPIIAWNADNSGMFINKDLNNYRILQMAPPIEHQVAAMIAILKRYNWHKFGVVMSKMAGSAQFLQICKEQAQLSKERNFKLEIVHTIEIDTDQDEKGIERDLLRLKSSDARILLLYCNQWHARKIFTVANKIGLTSDSYLWIGTQSVKGQFRQEKNKLKVQPGMLAVSFNTMSDTQISPPDDVLPVQIGHATKIFASSLAGMLADRINVSLLSTSSCVSHENFTWSTGNIIYKYMKNALVKGNPYHMKDGYDSFMYKFTDEGKLANSLLTISNLRPQPDGTCIWETVGEFSREEGLSIADIHWPGGQANPPQGTPEKFKLKVVTLLENPFIIASDLDRDTGRCPGDKGYKCDWGQIEQVDEVTGEIRNRTLEKCCTGYCVDLLELLANDIGFTFELYKVRDDKWGIKTENGWNGLIKDLIDEKADMCVTSLKLNSERARDIDFSIPYLETGISTIVKIRSGVLSPTAFLEPFEYSTWVFILLISIQGAAIAIFLFEWVSPSSFNMKMRPPPGHKFSLFRSYWLVWATLFSASVTTDVPRSSVSRFMSLVWAAFGLTFLAVYTANLAAFMITRVQYHDLIGLDDDKFQHPLDLQPPFRYGTVENGNTHDTLKRNYKAMNNYIKSNNFFTSNVSAGVEAVKNDELDAFIYDAVVLDYQVGKDANCEIMTVGKWSSMTGYGIGFPKNSKHVAKVNHFMLQYQQRGELERLHHFWLTGACNPNSQDRKTHSNPLGVENFLSAFVLLVGGILFGVLVLSCEYIYCNHLRKGLAKVDKRGWCGLISMAMGKSLSFTEAVNRVHIEWKERVRKQNSVPLEGYTREQVLERQLRQSRQEIRKLEQQLSEISEVNSRKTTLDNNASRRTTLEHGDEWGADGQLLPEDFFPESMVPAAPCDVPVTVRRRPDGQLQYESCL